MIARLATRAESLALPRANFTKDPERQAGKADEVDRVHAYLAASGGAVERAERGRRPARTQFGVRRSGRGRRTFGAPGGVEGVRRGEIGHGLRHWRPPLPHLRPRHQGFRRPRRDGGIHQPAREQGQAERFASTTVTWRSRSCTTSRSSPLRRRWTTTSPWRNPARWKARPGFASWATRPASRWRRCIRPTPSPFEDEFQLDGSRGQDHAGRPQRIAAVRG